MAAGVEEILPNDFGKYRLVRKIATGGMAEIFLAHAHNHPKDPIVIKRILPHLIKSAEFVSMFLDEARIAAQLEHPNIVRIHDIGQINGSYFIAMEYVHGEDIRRIYNCAYKLQRSLPLSHSIRVIADAACGLAYAHKLQDFSGHAMGVVHRDVSPQNILVTYDGGVKVVDFGIAKAANKVNQTRAGVLKGKYSYMSPEQALGDPIDHRTDIFALGIILYETTTGTRLFKRHNELATLQAIIKCEYVLPSEALPGYPPDLERVLLKALSKDPDDRHRGAQDFSDALYDFLHTSELYVEREMIAEFMRDLFKERLDEEARVGGPMLPHEDEAREEMADATTPMKSSSRLSAVPSHPYEPGEKTGNADTKLGRKESMAGYESPTEDEEPEGTSPEVDEDDLPLSDSTEAGDDSLDQPGKEAPSTIISPKGRAAQRVSTEVIRPREDNGAGAPLATEGQPPSDMLPTVAAEPVYRAPSPIAVPARAIEPERSMEPRRIAESTEQVRVRTAGASLPVIGDPRVEKSGERARVDRPPKSEDGERGAKSERASKGDDSERGAKSDRPDRSHDKERSDKAAKSDRPDRSSDKERSDKAAKNDRPDRPDRSSDKDRGDKDRGERGEKERAERREKAERGTDRRDRGVRALRDPGRVATYTEIHRGAMPRLAIALGAILAAVLAGIVASRIASSLSSGPTPIDTTETAGKFGRVTVVTEPGAAIWSGDQALGIATAEGVAGPFLLAAGAHKIRVTIEDVGFERDRTVEIAADRIHEFEIRGRKGWLSFRVQPWARVTVDGHDMGVTPLPNLQLYEGTHKVVLENDDIKKRHVQRVRVEFGQTFELKVNLNDTGAPM